MHAVFRPELAAILLEHGADPDLPDASGETARSWAAQSRSERVLALFQR